MLAAARDAAERRVRRLEERRARLVEVYVDEQGLDQAPYRRQLDELDEELTLARLERLDTAIEDVDVESGGPRRNEFEPTPGLVSSGGAVEAALGGLVRRIVIDLRAPPRRRPASGSGSRAHALG